MNSKTQTTAMIKNKSDHLRYILCTLFGIIIGSGITLAYAGLLMESSSNIKIAHEEALYLILLPINIFAGIIILFRFTAVNFRTFQIT